MLVIRPVAMQDLDSLLMLAEQTGFGLTTLPRDRELLRERVSESLISFENMHRKPRGEAFLFVMEDLRLGRVVGTAGVVSKVGGFEPFYAYKIESTLHESEMLNVHKQVPTLHLVTDHNGPCEIGSLFLEPAYRKDGNGRALSLARLLFIAEFRERFDPLVIAELRGQVDQRGGSPFWEAIGHHFFDIEFPKADYLSMVNKKFIADLMPRHPIYIPLLPKEAQDVIGQVHGDSAPAMKILEAEGFEYSKMVDIFEAGPIVRCKRDQIRTVQQGIKLPVVQVSDEPIDSEPHLISDARIDFRVCQGKVQRMGDGVRINTGQALSLQVKVGDPVRIVTLKGTAHVRKEEPFREGPMD